MSDDSADKRYVPDPQALEDELGKRRGVRPDEIGMPQGFNPAMFNEAEEYIYRNQVHFINWLDARIARLEELESTIRSIEKAHSEEGTVNTREYHERVELKLDRVTGKMTELLAKIDADNTAQNGAVTGSQLDTDYSDIDSDA